MRNRWCWWRRKRSASWLAGLTLGLLAAPLGAATVLERTERHQVQPDGSVRESVSLRVRLDSELDLRSWSEVSIYLDDHRSLKEVTAFALRPDGQRVEVRKKDHDIVAAPGAGVLHGSQRYHVVEWPALPAGSVLHLAYTVEARPYFSGGTITLGAGDPVAALRVEVSGAPDLRWHLDQDSMVWGQDALRLEVSAGSVRVVGEGLPAIEPPELGPDQAGSGPVLRYAWGPQTTWVDVAAWYQGLLESLPPPSAAVADQARSLVAGIDDRRERLEALLAFARQKVRYVAVEMGIGGYRPSPPPEVMERGWGDCKDKSTLLVEMLRAVGIPAHPALIASGSSRRIDSALPTPFQFNHAIVAVPVEGLEIADGDPVGGGLLFVDPTDPEGSSRWLGPEVQDQDALVVRGEASSLVRTPILFRQDRRELSVELEVGAAGEARGHAELVLSGRWGGLFRELLDEEAADRIEEAVRSVMGTLLPGASLSAVVWGQNLDQGPPRVVLQAVLELPGWVGSRGGDLSLRIPGMQGVPAPSLLDERALPVVARPGVTVETWRVRLPPGLCPTPGELEVANRLGSFRQTVGGEAGLLQVERAVELRQRWIEPSDFEGLKELGLAETRAKKRRVRAGPCEAASNHQAGG